MTDRELLKDCYHGIVAAINSGDWKPDGSSGHLTLISRLIDRLAQPEREWVGLTDDESIFQEGLKQLEGTRPYCFLLGAKWAETKLKEKNT